MAVAVPTVSHAPAASAVAAPLSSKPVLVSMGDSFASGEANPPFDRGTNDVPILLSIRKNLCHRSSASAARLLGATATTQIACSGAKIDDVVTRGKWPDGAPDNRSQIDQLKDLVGNKFRPSIDAVTISIGGNDLDFGGIVAECYSKIIGDCLSDLGVRLRNIDAVTTRLRDVVYPAIRQALGSQVPILVVGYPRLFPADNRPAVKCSWLSTEERRRANQLQDRFDASTAAAVLDTTAQNIKYISMLDTSAGHDSAGHELCTQDSWLHPVGPECKFGFDFASKAYCAHPLAKLQYAMAVRLLGWTPRHFDASKLGCGSRCTVTGQIMFKHPSWGFVTLVTTQDADQGGFGFDGRIFVVDRNDQIKYRSLVVKDLGIGFLMPVQSFPDAARSSDDGNLFIKYGHDGGNWIITLRPTSGGFSDLGSTVPADDSWANYDVYGLNLKRTGVIVKWFRPSCSRYPECDHVHPTGQIFSWNGSGYQKLPKPDFNTRICVSSFPRPPGVWPATEVYSSTIACAEVVNLARAIKNVGRTGSTNTWNWGSSFMVNGFVCIREPIVDLGGGDYQCVSGSRVVSFFAV